MIGQFGQTDCYGDTLMAHIINQTAGGSTIVVLAKLTCNPFVIVYKWFESKDHFIKREKINSVE